MCGLQPTALQAALCGQDCGCPNALVNCTDLRCAISLVIIHHPLRFRDGSERPHKRRRQPQIGSESPLLAEGTANQSGDDFPRRPEPKRQCHVYICTCRTSPGSGTIVGRLLTCFRDAASRIRSFFSGRAPSTWTLSIRIPSVRSSCISSDRCSLAKRVEATPWLPARPVRPTR